MPDRPCRWPRDARGLCWQYEPGALLVSARDSFVPWRAWRLQRTGGYQGTVSRLLWWTYISTVYRCGCAVLSLIQDDE